MSKIFDVQLLTYLLPPALLFILQDQRKQQIIEFVDHNIIPWLLDQKVVFNVRKWAEYLVCTCIRMMFGTSQILFNIILATCKQIIISGHDWTRWRHHWRTVLKFKRSQTRDSFSRPAPKAGKSEIIKTSEYFFTEIWNW